MLSLFFVLLAASATAQVCVNSVKDAPVSCTGGSITTDTMSGCRTIVCTNGGDKLQALACDKGSSFELYKQAQTGTSVNKVCVGTQCVSANNGFAKGSIPICTEGTTTTTPTTTTTTTSSACFSTVAKAPVTCTSTVTADTTSGSCRTISCGTNGNTIKVQTCDKGGSFELYKQGSSGTPPKVCVGSTCIQNDGFAKGSYPTCSGTTITIPTTTLATTSKYPLHTGIVATIFWAGQGPSADTGWSQNYDSAWDIHWMEHYGGYDDPNNRNGWYPAAFTPKENPFYVAIPYTDFGDAGRKWDAFQRVPWANEKSSWGYQESMIKNRWVKITTNGKTVYAQVENAGPGPTDDWQYVFGGANTQPNTNFGWKAGIDVSPAVRDYISMDAVDTVDWQWVDAKDVPSGPWKNIVTTRQSCWSPNISACG
jgi:hypothetical protein